MGAAARIARKLGVCTVLLSATVFSASSDTARAVAEHRIRPGAILRMELSAGDYFITSYDSNVIRVSYNTATPKNNTRRKLSLTTAALKRRCVSATLQSMTSLLRSAFPPVGFMGAIEQRRFKSSRRDGRQGNRSW
jgi:hypothetical protein